MYQLDQHSLLRGITYSASPYKFQCGDSFKNLSVINFTGPNGAKACAYSCNMNLDADGEPQAYAPLDKPNLKSRDYLGDAGFKTTAQNEVLQTQWEAAVKVLEDLEKKRAEEAASLTAAARAAAAGASPPPPPTGSAKATAKLKISSPALT